MGEDHISVVVVLSGTHTGGNDRPEMSPATPPRHFETTIVYVFSFNSRGKISHLSKTFDIGDMYQQLGWAHGDKSSEHFSVNQLITVSTVNTDATGAEEPREKKTKTEPTTLIPS